MGRWWAWTRTRRLKLRRRAPIKTLCQPAMLGVATCHSRVVRRKKEWRGERASRLLFLSDACSREMSTPCNESLVPGDGNWLVEAGLHGQPWGNARRSVRRADRRARLARRRGATKARQQGGRFHLVPPHEQVPPLKGITANMPRSCPASSSNNARNCFAPSWFKD